LTQEEAENKEEVESRNFQRPSRLRREIAAALEGRPLERVSLVSLDTGEMHSFDTYPEALEFMKGRKGRWYLTAPGVGGPAGKKR
jgi:hypothetical protein